MRRDELKSKKEALSNNTLIPSQNITETAVEIEPYSLETSSPDAEKEIDEDLFNGDLPSPLSLSKDKSLSVSQSIASSSMARRNNSKASAKQNTVKKAAKKRGFI